jgi:uncharacterized membrane protein YeaQ/YmgE (transglycosylase-associated protein family)
LEVPEEPGRTEIGVLGDDWFAETGPQRRHGTASTGSPSRAASLPSDTASPLVERRAGGVRHHSSSAVRLARDILVCQGEVVLLLGILGFGLLVGAGAQLLLERAGHRIDWGTALIAGLGGSLLGGLLGSLLAGDGLALRPSGLIGSFVGALIITWAIGSWRGKKLAEQRAASKAAARSGRHHPKTHR